MPAYAETGEADETGGAKLRLDRGGVGPVCVYLVEDRRDAAQMARCGQCLDDCFLMPFDVDLDDQRFGTLEQRVDAGDAQDADILARIAAFVRRAVAEARGAAVRGVRRDRGDTGLTRDGGMARLNLCLEPVERDIVAQQRQGRSEGRRGRQELGGKLCCRWWAYR